MTNLGFKATVTVALLFLSCPAAAGNFRTKAVTSAELSGMRMFGGTNHEEPAATTNPPATALQTTTVALPVATATTLDVAMQVLQAAGAQGAAFSTHQVEKEQESVAAQASQASRNVTFLRKNSTATPSPEAYEEEMKMMISGVRSQMASAVEATVHQALADNAARASSAELAKWKEIHTPFDQELPFCDEAITLPPPPTTTTTTTTTMMSEPPAVGFAEPQPMAGPAGAPAFFAPGAAPAAPGGPGGPGGPGAPLAAPAPAAPPSPPPSFSAIGPVETTTLEPTTPIPLTTTIFPFKVYGRQSWCIMRATGVPTTTESLGSAGLGAEVDNFVDPSDFAMMFRKGKGPPGVPVHTFAANLDSKAPKTIDDLIREASARTKELKH